MTKNLLMTAGFASQIWNTDINWGAQERKERTVNNVRKSWKTSESLGFLVETNFD
jgi:hypothetical protein